MDYNATTLTPQRCNFFNLFLETSMFVKRVPCQIAIFITKFCNMIIWWSDARILLSLIELIITRSFYDQSLTIFTEVSIEKSTRLKMTDRAYEK